MARSGRPSWFKSAERMTLGLLLPEYGRAGVALQVNLDLFSGTEIVMTGLG
jgi:hypothetical protein